MARNPRVRALVALGAIGLYALGTGTPASAAAGTASAFAIKADVFGSNVIPETPAVSSTGADSDNTVIAIPGGPLVVSGTLIAKSAVKPGLLSELNQPPSKHAVAGPYNARAIGQIEDLNILINDGVPGRQLVNADLIRAEAVAKCTNGVPTYSASSEVVDLQIGGEDPFSGPLNDALKQITEGLAPLADLISVQLNVVSPDQSSVDAVVVTLLAAAEGGGAPGPLAEIRLGHAQITGNPCAGALPSSTQCSDGVDNADPEDVLVDALDPGCHEGDDLNKPYHPEDDDERNTLVLAGGALPGDGRTGAAIPTALAAGLGMAALGLLALRRRLV